jgi:hypothetical protein
MMKRAEVYRYPTIYSHQIPVFTPTLRPSDVFGLDGNVAQIWVWQYADASLAHGPPSGPHGSICASTVHDGGAITGVACVCVSRPSHPSHQNGHTPFWGTRADSSGMERPHRAMHGRMLLVVASSARAWHAPHGIRAPRQSCVMTQEATELPKTGTFSSAMRRRWHQRHTGRLQSRFKSSSGGAAIGQRDRSAALRSAHRPQHG